MTKKSKLLINILFIFLLGCGFNPVLKHTSINFSIEEINATGNDEINKKIISKLENYRNNTEKEKKYYLNINSIQNKTVTSKDTKGNPKTYKIEIKIIVRTSNINNEIVKKEFKEEISYNTLSSKFELGLYENNIKNNLTEKIAKNISAHLSSLK